MIHTLYMSIFFFDEEKTIELGIQHCRTPSGDP